MEEGRPFKVICEKADLLSIDSIIINTGDNFPAVNAIGNNAEKIIRNAPCHVVMINSHTKFDNNRVLCTYDFSPISVNCLKVAGSITAAMGKELDVLHIVNKLYFSSTLPFCGSQKTMLEYHHKQNRAKEGAATALDTDVSKIPPRQIYLLFWRMASFILNFYLPCYGLCFGTTSIFLNIPGNSMGLQRPLAR